MPSEPLRFFAAEHARQSPVQALLQQTPSTQKPLGQSDGWVHAVAMVVGSTRPMGSRRLGSSLEVMALPPAPKSSPASKVQPEAVMIVIAKNETGESGFMAFPSEVHGASTQWLLSLPIPGDTFMLLRLSISPQSVPDTFAAGVWGARRRRRSEAPNVQTGVWGEERHRRLVAPNVQPGSAELIDAFNCVPENAGTCCVNRADSRF